MVHVLQNPRIRKIVICASATFAAAAIALPSFLLWPRAHSQSPVDGLTSSLSAASDNGGQPVAFVNGTPIRALKVQVLQAAQSAGLAQPGSEQDIINALIDQELFYEAAQRAGLVPSAADVQAYMDRARATISASDMAAVLQMEKATYGFTGTAADYWNDPNIRKDYARSIAIGRYLASLGGNSADDRAQLQAAAAAKLRSAATVVIATPTVGD